MTSTTFVNLTLSGQYTHIHMRQFMTENTFNGNVRVNPDGLCLTTDEFASLMFQLRALEQSLTVATAEKSGSTSTQTAAVAAAADPRKRPAAAAATAGDSTARMKKPKRYDDLVLWYARVVKGNCLELAKSECFGCMMNIMDQHEKCEASIDEHLIAYFDKAMALVDGSAAAKELKMKNCPDKLDLLTTEGWRDEVKHCIRIKL